jgi:hypothetical protein
MHPGRNWQSNRAQRDLATQARAARSGSSSTRSAVWQLKRAQRDNDGLGVVELSVAAAASATGVPSDRRAYQASQPRPAVAPVAGSDGLLCPPDMKVPTRLPLVIGKWRTDG